MQLTTQGPSQDPTGAGARDPADFPGNPNPPPQIPSAPTSAPAGSSATASTSAGTGALPPSSAGAAATSSAAPVFSSDPWQNSIRENMDGGHDAFVEDAQGPHKLFTIQLAPQDTQKVLEATGAVYDKEKGSYTNISDDTLKALNQGRPALVDYWKEQYNIPEEQAVKNASAQLYVDKKISLEEYRNQTHLPTLQMQLADRPDMAWTGKTGIIADALQNPMTALERGVESAGGTVLHLKDALLPVLEIAGASMAVGAAGAAAGVPVIGAWASRAVSAAAFYEMQRRQVMTHMADQGYDPDTVKEVSRVAGGISGVLGAGAFELMSPLSKARFLDGLVKSALAKRAVANWVVKSAGVGGGVMATQQAIESALENLVAYIKDRPDLLEDPKTVMGKIIDTLISGAALGVVAGGAMKLLGEGFAKLTPEEKSSPEGKKTERLIEAGKKEGLEDSVKRYLSPPEMPQTSKETPQESSQSRPASEQADPEKPSGSPSQTPSTSSQPVPGTPVAGTQEGASTESNSSSESEKSVPQLEGPRQYVPEQELGKIPIGDAKASVKEILQRHSEIFNRWIAPGNQLVDELKQAVPKADVPGLQWYYETQGDEAALRSALADPEYAAIHDELKSALNLSPEGKAAVDTMRRFYEEAGATSKANGTIKNLTDNFQSRYYLPNEEEGIKGGTQGNRPFGQTTPHARERVFDSAFDAVKAGYKLAGNAIERLALYNAEMAKVNTNRAVADGLVDQHMAVWAREAPARDWRPVGDLEKQAPVTLKDGTPTVLRYHLYAPEGLAKGMKSLVDPDWFRKISGVNEYMRAQGTLKTGLLSWSFFHHLTFLTQAASSGNWKVFGDLGKMTEHLNSPEFKAMELDAVGHGLETAMTHGNLDIIQVLTAKDQPFADLANKPGVKELLNQTDKNSQLLFGKMQRMFKVYDYASKASAWMESHPGATEIETQAAKREIARYVNPTYGGLNWTAMGVSKAWQSIMRSVLLAPDWLASGITVLKQAVAEKGLAGNLSRAYVVRGLGLGLLATEGLNYLRTGHFTDKNDPGHKLEIDLGHHVYLSLIRGPLGEMSKMESMIAETGLQGESRYLGTKLAPFMSAAIGLMFNIAYSGKEIVPRRSQTEPHINPATGRTVHTEPTGPIAGTWDVLKWLTGKLTPTPFAITNLVEYLANEGLTPQAAAVTAGVGRYSRGKKEKSSDKGRLY